MRLWRRCRRRYCSAVLQGELPQAGGDVSVQVGCVVGRHVGVRVRQQEMTRARYVLGESDGQTRPAPLLERESGGLHQQPANSDRVNNAFIMYMCVTVVPLKKNLSWYDNNINNIITWPMHCLYTAYI